MAGSPIGKSDGAAYWRIKTEDLAQALSTDLSKGLSSAEARRRLELHGHNQLQEKAGTPAWAMFLEQFRQVIIWVLIGAALISGLLKEWIDAVAIIGIVILNAVLGFIQEYRAEKSLAALRKLSSPTSRALRDGKHSVVPSSELVPGDIIEIEAGDHIPADCRVLSHTANFAVQEASLTGESAPVAKSSPAIDTADVALGDRVNMLFMGTAVVSGRARAVVVVTAMRTELGRIAGMIQEIGSEPTPLQKKLDEFGKLTVKICVALVALVFLMQLLRGGHLLDVFLTAVSLAVAAIPEGLPAVVTIALALGVRRMVRRNALIRKLPSVETLGCATVICSDKTGTLTRNEMTVQAVYAGGQRYQVSGGGYEPRGAITLNGQPVAGPDLADLRTALLCGTLCNGAQLAEENGNFRVVGDPTEGALLTAAAKLGLWKGELEKEYVYVEELPFDSTRKKMSVVRRRHDGSLTVYVKGAPDVLLADCREVLAGGQRRPLTEADRDQIHAMNATLANEAMRVLAVACRELRDMPAAATAATLERDLVFVGLLAMMDPPRDEAREAMRKCDTAGIKVVMITGDHKNTAMAVGRDLGLCREGSLALAGDELDRWDDLQLRENVDRIAVYARVSPEHKLRVVRAWRARGEIVAMTGDGVNDAPAVKEADIGVAMGITGTDVTKEVADMVVTDDNFASIVAAVEEGRGIYDNIRKFIHYLLSCNAGEVLVMFLSSLMGLPAPLLPIHILWVNLVTDGLPALALGVDPVAPGIMRRKPRAPAEPVVDRTDGLIMLGEGLFLALCTLAAFGCVLYAWHSPLAEARTAAFVVLALSQLFHAYNCRSRTESLFALGVFTNAKLLYATAVSAALQIGVVCTPALSAVFKTHPLAARTWVLVIVLSSLPFWAMEAAKWIARRRSGT